MLSDSESTANSINQGHGLVEQIRKISVKFLSARLRGVFDTANSALIDLANNPDNSQDYAIYMDGVRALGQQRQGVEEAFVIQTGVAFTGFMQGLGAKHSGVDEGLDASELSLVDESELEESLALVDMGEKANNRYPEELFAIEQRFDAVVDDFDVDIDQIPIVPRMICRTFNESVKQLGVDARVKLVVFELFNEHVLAELKPMYDEANSLFIKAGILPTLKRTVKKQPESEQQEPEPEPQPQSQAQQDVGWLDSESVESAQQQAPASSGVLGDAMPPAYLLDTMQQLLANQVPGELSPTGHRALASQEMMQALANVQFDTSAVDVSATVDDVKKSLRGEMVALKKTGEYSPLDRSIIDIVSLLFDYILNDDDLPSTAKVILARLQMPMLKVAMLDSELFSSKQHVARRLLDKMAGAAVGLADDANSETCSIIKKIEETVIRVLAEFADDTALFDELLKDFEDFLEQQAAEEEAARLEGLARLKEKEKRSAASTYVADYLASYLKDRDIPRPAYELIEGPWEEVMTNTYLNEGAASELWKENLRFVDELLWSIDPNKNEAERKSLGKVVFNIISTFNNAIEQIDYPKEKLDKILSGLGELHILIMRNDDAIKHSPVVRVKIDPEREIKIEHENKEDITRELDAMRESLSQMEDMDTILNEAFDGIAVDKKTPPPMFVFDEESVEEVNMSATPLDDKRKPTIDDEYWRMVLDLPAGQWISLTDKSGATKRAKLAWKSDMLGECTFINWRFKVIADLNFNQLATRFRNGKAALVDSLPLFERAFDTVMNKLQKGVSLFNNPQTQ